MALGDPGGSTSCRGPLKLRSPGCAAPDADRYREDSKPMPLLKALERSLLWRGPSSSSKECARSAGSSGMGSGTTCARSCAPLPDLVEVMGGIRSRMERPQKLRMGVNPCSNARSARPGPRQASSTPTKAELLDASGSPTSQTPPPPPSGALDVNFGLSAKCCACCTEIDETPWMEPVQSAPEGPRRPRTAAWGSWSTVTAEKPQEGGGRCCA